MPDVENEGDPSVEDILRESGVDTGEAEAETDVNAALKPSGQGPSKTQKGTQGNLIFGKYKSIEEAAKGHKSLQGALSQKSEKVKNLEAIVNNPRFRELAKTDPEMRETLQKAGYALAEEEEEIEARAEQAEEAEKGKWAWDGDPNHPAALFATFETKMLFKDQQKEIEEGLGRKLSKPEVGEIQQVIRTTGGKLDVLKAWRVTDAFQNAIAEKHNRELEDVRRQRTSGSTMRPDPRLVGSGQKLDLSKDVTKMNSAESAEFLMDIVRKGK